jgi:MFS transporter, DHA2 family, multidrug resistance protein
MSDPTPRPATRRDWIGLAVLVLPVMLISVDVTVLYLALPFISASLGPSATELLWIVDIYGFVLAGLLITMGNVGDRIGRRRLLLLGAATFGIASLLAANATEPAMLIGARALMGVGGATLMPSTLSLIRSLFSDPRQRTAAIAIWTGGFSAGIALGPLLGGWLLEQFPWGAVFLINVPVMVALLVAAPLVLPEFRDSDPGPIDPLSVGLSIVAILAVIFGLKRFAEDGLVGDAAIAVVVGIAAGAVFLRRQRRVERPLIALDLFRDARFATAIGANVVTTFALVGSSLYTAQYLQLVLGMGPFEAGLWSLPAAVAVFVGATVAAIGSRRVGPANIVAGGMTTAAVGFLILTQLGTGDGLPLLVAGSIVMAFGVSMVLTLAADLVLGVAPVGRAGAASGLSETGSELGGALGIAILGSIGAAIYRSGLATSLPVGLPAEASAAARETLGAALAVAGTLPTDVAEALVAAARSAFASGLQVAALSGAFVMVLSGLVVAVVLRGARLPASDEGSTPRREPLLRGPRASAPEPR